MPAGFGSLDGLTRRVGAMPLHASGCLQARSGKHGIVEGWLHGLRMACPAATPGLVPHTRPCTRRLSQSTPLASPAIGSSRWLTQADPWRFRSATIPGHAIQVIDSRSDGLRIPDLDCPALSCDPQASVKESGPAHFSDTQRPPGRGEYASNSPRGREHGSQ